MKILFFGDSITDAGRARDREGHISSLGYGYVNQVAGALSFEDPTAYTFVNRGISGNRIVDLYSRIKADVWNESPDVLSILIGVNDVWHDLGDKPNGVDVERFEKVYRMLLEDTKKVLPSTKIILCEPFFLHGIATDYNDGYEHFCQVPNYAAVVKKLAKEFNLPLVELQDKFDEAAAKYGYDKVLADGVHPNSFGAALIAKEWLSVFKKEV
jgi:lysophospholipase L1-like esterase